MSFNTCFTVLNDAGSQAVELIADDLFDRGTNLDRTFAQERFSIGNLQFCGQGDDPMAEQAMRHGGVDKSCDGPAMHQLSISLGLQPVFQDPVQLSCFGELPGQRVKPGWGEPIPQSLSLHALQTLAARDVKLM